MKNKIIIGISILLMIYGWFPIKVQGVHPKTNRQGPDISVMYHYPELAEEYCRNTVTAFAPDQESLNITFCKAQYIPLYRAYVVNCYFDTNDAYGELQSYKIQMKVQILPDGNGGLKYNALDFKEIR